MKSAVFDRGCRACPRLAEFLDDVSDKYPDYYCRPVPPFGDDAARFLIVGLAPGMHGANRTGRPFTGDHAGILLYQTLHKFGFSSHAESTAIDDDLTLTDCRITNAVKCLPPDNKPIGVEINTCNSFLANELETLSPVSVVLALGRRGTPRKLGVKGEELAKVMYSLLDAKAYEGKRILVVGGGDSAVEAAMGLAVQEGNEVVLSYRKALECFELAH